MKDKIFQIKLSHLIIGGILLLLLIFLLKCNPNPTIPHDYSKNKQEIEKLKQEIQILKDIQSGLNITTQEQKKHIDSLTLEINITKKELQKTRTYYGNKIKNITSSTPSELDNFFAERYK
jgi:septal ring factor EnvC (AmiA/AmiB activator)